MTGIVVVSHSRALARAAVALATEMAGADPPRIEVAAGLDEDTTGTDATAVAAALTAADDGEGVLVLLDLGSAVLSTELALELVDAGLAARVRVSPAPMIEGLVAAVARAATGGGPEQLDAEARAGLRGKQQHLAGEGGPRGASVAGGTPTVTSGEGEPDATAEIVLHDPHGLHARPAARLARAVAAHPGVRVEVTDLDGGQGPVDGRSMSALAALGARQGHRLRVAGWGPGSRAALAAIEQVAAGGFRAPGGEGLPARADPARQATPVPGSGLEAALGRSRRVGAVAVDLSRYRPGTPQEERSRLQQALTTAAEELRDLVGRTRLTLGEEEAAVLLAHLDLLHDPALLEPAQDAVSHGEPAARAWQQQVGRVREQLARLPDPYQRDRARDVDEVGTRVLQRLVGAGTTPGESEAPGLGAGDHRGAVLVLDELDVGTAATIDGSRVAGVVTVRGGATGHGVLLARARGIPVVTGAGRQAEVPDGTLLGLDARRQEVYPDPDEVTRSRLTRLLQARHREREQALVAAQEPGRTADGVPVPVEANLGVAAETGPAVAAGADGCGLLRTEVLFAGWREPPTVAEQVAVLSGVADDLEGRPLTVRTWDVGGDKPLSFLSAQPGANPFLGVRGIRACQAAPAVLVDQLEALCRVADRYPVRVMFPMVTTRAEVDWALARVDEAAARLAGGRPDGLQVGVMVEVPAAALRAAPLSAGLDFLSIGSNDLSQYALAAERGNPALEHLADQADPALLRLVATVCREARAGVRVAVCGAAAGEPALAAVLVGLGVRELSASAASVPGVKAVLRRYRVAELEELAGQALRRGSAAEVRQLLEPLRE